MPPQTPVWLSLSSSLSGVVRNLLVLVLVLHVFPSVVGALPCLTDDDCVQRLQEGLSRANPLNSVCVRGQCSNPYHRGGCLSQLQQLQQLNQEQDDSEQQQNKQSLSSSLTTTTTTRSFRRACHSEDSATAVASGYCETSALAYPEVRIYAQNWASALFLAWTLQIVLSELLHVPATLESSSPDLTVDFYHHAAAYGFAGSNDWNAFRTAQEVGGDCTAVVSKASQNKQYKSCATVVPEVWPGHVVALNRLQDEGAIEVPQEVGSLGLQGWYVPRFVAQRDPTVTSYLGLQGAENRHKLAKLFKRPTTWQDYCLYVSNTTCAEPDHVAQRAPHSREEQDRYFVEGLYQGHFRATEKNNCEKWPHNCTGHFTDYPCGWSSHFLGQAHHLDIALESDGPEPVAKGYTYLQLFEVWAAANATKSNIIMLAWTPSVLYQTYLGTDAEFLKVALTPPTQRCVRHRTDVSVRCATTDEKLRYGHPLGRCDEPPHLLHKIVSPTIYHQSNRGRPDALVSPAYDGVRNFRITQFQVGTMLDGLVNGQVGDPAIDARDAVCGWVQDNLDDLLTLIVPPTFPRTVREKQSRGIMNHAATAVTIVAIMATLGVAFTSYRERENPKIQRAMVEFLVFLLVGLLMVSTGGLLLSVANRDEQCVTVVYLVNLGYTFELVPLIVKTSAIFRQWMSRYWISPAFEVPSHLSGSSDRTNAATNGKPMSRAKLFRNVALASSIMLVLLLIWTWQDPPHKASEFFLTTEVTHEGATIVEESQYCGGDDDDGWVLFGLSWQIVLLFMATILAFQTRHIKEDSDVAALALLIYSHAVFVVLRAVVYFTREALGFTETSAFLSILYGLDSLANLGIYFVPKLFEHERPESSSHAQQLGFFQSFTLASSLQLRLRERLDRIRYALDMSRSQFGVSVVEQVPDKESELETPVTDVTTSNQRGTEPTGTSSSSAAAQVLLQRDTPLTPTEEESEESEQAAAQFLEEGQINSTTTTTTSIMGTSEPPPVRVKFLLAEQQPIVPEDSYLVSLSSSEESMDDNKNNNKKNQPQQQQQRDDDDDCIRDAVSSPSTAATDTVVVVVMDPAPPPVETSSILASSSEQQQQQQQIADPELSSENAAPVVPVRLLTEKVPTTAEEEVPTSGVALPQDLQVSGQQQDDDDHHPQQVSDSVP